MLASASDDSTVRIWGPAPSLEGQDAEGANGKEVMSRCATTLTGYDVMLCHYIEKMVVF